MNEIRRTAGRSLRGKHALRPISAAILIGVAPPIYALTVLNSSTTTQTLSTDTSYQLNAGSMVSTTIGNAINVEGIAPATFINAGTIISSVNNQAAGIRFDVSGSLINQATGRISGNTYGVFMNGGGSNNNVTNMGDISVQASHAIAYGGTTSGTIDNFGTLNGGTAGPVGLTADGIYLDSTGTVTVNNHVGASIRSGVNGSSYGVGIAVVSGSVTINNDGTINSYHEGVVATTTTAVNVTNSSTGVIRGTLEPGVQFDYTGTLVNNGAISSTLAPGVDISYGQITNNGQISSASAAAIQLGGKDNSVTLGTGSALSGANNESILSISPGNTLTLTGTDTENGNFTSASLSTGFAQLTLTSGSNWTLGGNVTMSGSSAATESILGHLTLGGTLLNSPGSGATIASGGELTLGTGGAGGSVTGNIVNNGLLEFNRSDSAIFNNQITGSGTMLQDGTGTTILTGTGSTQGNVSVNAGTLLLAQSGTFNTTGNYATAAGATTAVLGRATLVAGNQFTMNGTLDSVAGNASPPVTASTATIGSGTTFNLAGYTATPAESASQLASSVFTEIHTTAPGGLSGAFSTVWIGGSAGPADYLTLTSAYTAQDYKVGVGLTWYAVLSTTPQAANGVFTLSSAADSFNMDVPLADQPANPATGWDGKTLTKAGAGTLQLSGANTYTGATLIDGGTLQAGAANVFASSSQVAVAAGALLDLNSFDQQANNLTGSGNVSLGTATLTANNTASTTFGGIISGSGGLNKTGAGPLILSGDSSYTGATTIAAGALLLSNGAQLAGTPQVTVAQGATLGGYGGVGGNVTNNGLLAVADAAPGFSGAGAGSFTVGGQLVNSGEIRMASPTPASTLTVAGNYTGNNGLLSLSTALGGDPSPTDRLVVRGNTTGQTSVAVQNAGGEGGETANGIQIIQVDGQSNGVFSLNGRVVAGAYQYDLYKGGINTPDDGDWYLRSLSLGPSPEPVPRPETGGYLSNQVAAQDMFIHTLHDRAGLPDPAGTDGAAGDAPTAWVRATGGRVDSQAAGGLVAEATDSALVQAGIDLFHRVANNQRWQAGIMAGYGSATTDSSSQGNPATARSYVNGTNAGIYGTWHGNAAGSDGPYVDSWVQYTHYDNTVNGSGLSGESYSSQVWSGSVEGGWAFMLGHTSTGPVLLEPQLQFIYSGYQMDDHTESNGTVVHSEDSGGLITRLGARLFHAPGSSTAPAWLPFIEVNWWHNSSGNAIAFDNTVITQDGPKNRAELKVGLQAQLAKQWRVWGHLGFQQGDGGYRSFDGLLGARYMW